MSILKNDILELRKKGKTYREIQDQLQCSKALISYYCGTDQKLKTIQRQKNRRSRCHPFVNKLERFKYESKTQIKQRDKILRKNHNLIMNKIHDFNTKRGEMGDVTLEKIIEKYSDNPVCYLTGQKIDINQPRTYHFDHKTPVSRGGSNTIENLGLCTKQANMAKSDMTEQEFVAFCESVIKYQQKQQESNLCPTVK